jgi:hypothetical protein
MTQPTDVLEKFLSGLHQLYNLYDVVIWNQFLLDASQTQEIFFHVSITMLEKKLNELSIADPFLKTPFKSF